MRIRVSPANAASYEGDLFDFVVLHAIAPDEIAEIVGDLHADGESILHRAGTRIILEKI